MPLRVLLVDDEQPARDRLRQLLAGVGDVEVIGEAEDGVQAVERVAELRPDLILLDIQMPGCSGLEVAASLGRPRPAIIFCTAYDQYAVDAFELQALDYLLKPVNRARFYETVGRAKTQIRSGRSGAASDQLAALVEQLSARPQQMERLAIKVSGRIVFLKVDEIDWIEAVDDYARIHAGRQVHLVRDTLTRLESRLPPEQFLRIHRSTIVNVDRVKEVQTWFQGDYLLILADGTRLTSGRSYRQKLQRFLQQSS